MKKVLNSLQYKVKLEVVCDLHLADAQTMFVK